MKLADELDKAAVGFEERFVKSLDLWWNGRLHYGWTHELCFKGLRIVFRPMRHEIAVYCRKTLSGMVHWDPPGPWESAGDVRPAGVFDDLKEWLGEIQSDIDFFVSLGAAQTSQEAWGKDEFCMDWTLPLKCGTFSMRATPGEEEDDIFTELKFFGRHPAVEWSWRRGSGLLKDCAGEWVRMAMKDNESKSFLKGIPSRAEFLAALPLALRMAAVEA